MEKIRARAHGCTRLRGERFADGPIFTSFDYPGATSTFAWGINTRGDIVGSYLNPDKSDHGFC